MQEGQDNTIHLPDDHPNIVDAMLNFLYHAEYNLPPASDGKYNTLIFHIQLYAVANKYMIEELKTVVQQKFLVAAEQLWNNTAFPDTIRDLYDYPSGACHDLKDTVVDVTLDHAVALFNGDRFSHFQKVMEQTPEFSATIAKKMVNASVITTASGLGVKPVTWYKCPCHRCKANQAVFCLAQDVDPLQEFVCPSDQSRGTPMRFWVQYKLDMVGSSK